MLSFLPSLPICLSTACLHCLISRRQARVYKVGRRERRACSDVCLPRRNDSARGGETRCPGWLGDVLAPDCENLEGAKGGGPSIKERRHGTWIGYDDDDDDDDVGQREMRCSPTCAWLAATGE
ncbi:hypothetical protein BC567DRAFT_58032 [Phyllosticta citribraziliensis]